MNPIAIETPVKRIPSNSETEALIQEACRVLRTEPRFVILGKLVVEHAGWIFGEVYTTQYDLYLGFVACEMPAPKHPRGWEVVEA